jgi:hypothetical protein
MERNRKMDSAGRTSNGRPLSRIPALAIAALISISSILSQSQDQLSLLDQLKQLSAAGRWPELLKLAGSTPTASPELDFYQGTAWAHLARWEEARQAFLAGARLQPMDKRFPQELAGIEFKQKRYPEAVRFLHRALPLDPSDSYTLDFLGTIYFLEGNLESALKYWNRVGKPHLASVVSEPEPRLKPGLLDGTFAFAPASMLTPAELLTSEARVRELAIFPSFRFDLQVKDNGNFDILFRNREKDGCGGKWECVFGLLRGLPAQSVYPEFFNLAQGDFNLLGFYRWDAQKRRVDAEFSGPLASSTEHRFRLLVDLRDENWAIRNSFTGSAPLLGALKLRREAISADFASAPSFRWQWGAGAEVSHRNFGDVLAGSSLTPNLLASGYQLKQTTRINGNLWRIPERRFTVDAGASSQLGRVWSKPYHTFEKLQGSLRLHWLPTSEGDDYEFQEQVRAGKTLGTAPFDELYTLGVLGDTDLLMRAHIATRDGRKGSGPLGSDYFLSNWEADKNVYRAAPFAVKAGPFLDTGKITGASPGLGSRQWLCDVGAQIKMKVLGTGAVFAYGRDLRSGNNAITIRLQ